MWTSRIAAEAHGADACRGDGSLDTLRLLLKRRDVNARNSGGATALMWAV